MKMKGLCFVLIVALDGFATHSLGSRMPLSEAQRHTALIS
jgi:hypothetical protein